MRRIAMAAVLIAACGGDEPVQRGELDAGGEDSGAGEALDAGERVDDVSAVDAGEPDAVGDLDASAWPIIPPPEDPRCTEGPMPDGARIFYLTGGNGVRTREQADEARAATGPVDYDPPADRWAHLARTRETLCARGQLRVNMLGDSIINDTSRSLWEEYLSDATGADVRKLTIVRGSTGPGWYQEGDRPYCYAARFAPDLLIMGGISMLDMDAWRTLIEKVRAESDAEILLMTQAFGRLIDPGNAETWALEPEDDPDPYRVNLRALAEELGVGFLDMTREWGRYVNDSGEGIEAFKRDQHHANERGEQILGRVLKAHLDPRVGGNACE